MIIRIILDFQDGRYKVQSEDTVHVTTDKAEYLFNLLNKNFIIEESLNIGKGFTDSQVRFSLKDVNGILNKMFDDNERGIIDGKKIVVQGFKEELNGTWALVEKYKWTGRITDHNKADINEFQFLATSFYSNLDKVVPNETLNEVEYPNILEGNIGEYKPWIYGNINGADGNLVAPNVGINEYFVCAFDITAHNAIAKQIFWRNVEIDKSLWGVLIRDGATYITYIPPAADDELPANDVEFISVNVETEKINPILVLKDILYRSTKNYNFYNGDTALETDFTNRDINFAGAIRDGDKNREVITEFCSEFNLYSYLTDDEKLKLIPIGGASQQTFTDDTIKGAREESIKNEIVNDVDFQFQYNYTESRFVMKKNYKHRKSIQLSETRKGTKNYYFVEDGEVAMELVKGYIQQRKYGKKKIFLDLNYSDIENRKLGDTISARSKYLSGVTLKEYIISKLTTDLISENSTIEAITYISETDCIVNVHRDIYGGDIDLLGMNAVQGGQNMIIKIDVLTGFTVGFYWLDGVKQTATDEIILTNITEDHDIYIVFNTVKCIIQASDDGNVTIDPKGQVLVTSGNDQQFNVASGFSYYLVDGEKKYTNPYTIPAVVDGHTIIAHGSTTYKATVTITLNYDNTKGEIEPYKRETVVKPKRSPIYLKFKPKSGCQITLVKVDGVDKTTAAKNSTPAGLYLGKVTADTTVEVTFEVL